MNATEMLAAIANGDIDDMLKATKKYSFLSIENIIELDTPIIKETAKTNAAKSIAYLAVIAELQAALQGMQKDGVCDYRLDEAIALAAKALELEGRNG